VCLVYRRKVGNGSSQRDLWCSRLSFDNKVSYCKQIAHQYSFHKILSGQGPCLTIKILFSSSLITMQNLIAACHTIRVTVALRLSARSRLWPSRNTSPHACYRAKFGLPRSKGTSVDMEIRRQNGFFRGHSRSSEPTDIDLYLWLPISDP